MISGSKQLKKVTLQITGMTCAACVIHNEEALKELPGVRNVVVNLATGKAMVEYDPDKVSLKDMKKAVSEAGYDVVLDSAQFKIMGMTCQSCVNNIETAVNELPGVWKIVVNLPAESGSVEYSPDITSLAEIKRTIVDLGYQVSEKVEGTEAIDREREARQKEIGRQRNNLIIAATPGEEDEIWQRVAEPTHGAERECPFTNWDDELRVDAQDRKVSLEDTFCGEHPGEELSEWPNWLTCPSAAGECSGSTSRAWHS